MKNPLYKAIGTPPPSFVAGFDSSAGMVKALGSFLSENSFKHLLDGVYPREVIGNAINGLPKDAREDLYVLGGIMESVNPEDIASIRSETFSQWVTSLYPKRTYNSVMIGSSNGALTHLAAAMGIPWLPQTFLIPVLRPVEMHIDDPTATMEWAINPANDLLDANPDLRLYHMFDPSQDRLMLEHKTYFRAKKIRLGPTYEEFLWNQVESGGTIYIIDCKRTWETTQISDRHIFQFGGMGGVTEKMYQKGSPEIKAFLQKYDSPVTKWNPPKTNGRTPESEWGYDEELTQDIERVAKDRGLTIKRLSFEEPEHLSPYVADLYNWWYKRRGITANRLFVESFMLLDPYWALRTGSVPFWMKFNMQPSLDWLRDYLTTRGSFDEIYLTLFSNGVDTVNLPDIEDWKELLTYANKTSSFLGMQENKFPRDFGVFVKYRREIQEKIKSRYSLPGYLSWEDLEQFESESKHEYSLKWE